MKLLDVTTTSTALFVALASACATANAGTNSDVPEALKVQASERLSLEASATGVQIYECKASKDDPLKFEWAFKAPEAELFDSAGKSIGKHYAGPTWE